MAVFAEVTAFECPRCKSVLVPEAGAETRCPACKWRGKAWLLRPLLLQAEKAAQALPQDAVCVNHPAKQAVAVCAGSGDYICALCRVELNGQTFSAAYLSRAGKGKLDEAFRRNLPRPDRALAFCLLLSLFVFFVSPITVPIAIVQFFKMRSLRKKDATYRRVVGRASVIVSGIVVFAAGALILAGLGFLLAEAVS